MSKMEKTSRNRPTNCIFQMARFAGDVLFAVAVRVVQGGTKRGCGRIVKDSGTFLLSELPSFLRHAGANSLTFASFMPFPSLHPTNFLPYPILFPDRPDIVQSSPLTVTPSEMAKTVTISWASLYPTIFSLR